MAIYLDYAAATPLDERVRAAMLPYWKEQFYNPSADYLAARTVRASLESARSQTAQVLGARPSEIIFTAGSTEANNMAILGIGNRFPGKQIIVSALEHDSIRLPALTHGGIEVAVTPDGRVDCDVLQHSIRDTTVLVSVMYANNEIGTIQPLRSIAAIVRAKRDERRLSNNPLPLYFHTDATQAANYCDLHVARLGIDLMTLNGGKIYGPKQSGILWVKTGVDLQPTLLGGGQEQSLRSGTENVPGVIGFSVALTIAQELRLSESKRLTAMQRLFITLLEERFPGVVINGSLKYRLPNNVHITIPGADNERILMALDERGVMAAAGSACSASDVEPSHVLLAIGKSTAEAQASLRFTMGRQTTEQEILEVINILSAIIG